MQPYDPDTCEPVQFRGRNELGDDPPVKPPMYDNFTPYPDHVLYYSEDPETGAVTDFSLPRTQYFLDKLEDCSVLEGFFPRWILPGTEIKPSETSSGPIST